MPFQKTRFVQAGQVGEKGLDKRDHAGREAIAGLDLVVAIRFTKRDQPDLSPDQLDGAFEDQAQNGAQIEL